ncbi:hypothetical protein EFL45_07080 [Weissella confusa]|uniref:hypothetical protein n=1 Tax=Weissella confusa TaxID=1583 RepID=UPI00223C3422|nr:hypothetical protein [Weissella confusa]MCT0949174.1 hypothetical protein [Weissella confusa]
MNKETEQEYLAKKVPALRTTHYEKVTVDVPDKFGIVRAAQEFLAALHFADMQDLDDNQEQVATNVNVQSAWVDLQMAYEGLVEDMGDKPKSTTTEQVVNDPLGLYDATGKLYKAIESKDLEVALSHVKYMEEIARTYADPGSAAHDPFNLLELTEKLNSAIDAEDKSQANDVLAELAEKVQDGMKRAKADREFNENN